MTPSRTRPAQNALFFVAVLVAANLAVLNVSAGDTVDHVVEFYFQELNHDPMLTVDGVLPELHGYGANVMLNVMDTKLTVQEIQVHVTSNSDGSGEHITLYRTLSHPGGDVHYLGFVGFETTRIAGNGQVRVQADDRVTAVYMDTDGEAREASLRWKQTHDGEVRLDNTDYFGLGEEVEIEVRDPDIPTGDTFFCVQVWSESDPTGFNMSLARVAEGRYLGVLGFNDEASSLPQDQEGCDENPALPQIQVANGDTFYVGYNEEGPDARGRPEAPKAWALFHGTHSGKIQFVTEDYLSLVSDKAAGDPLDDVTVVRGVDDGRTVATSNAWIRVEDRDLCGQGRIVVNVRSIIPATESSEGVDPSGRNVVLYETTYDSDGPRGRDFGAGSCEFLGHIGFVTGQPSQPTAHPGCDPRGESLCRLRVKEGAHVIARYGDEHNGIGDFEVAEARVSWEQHHTGVVAFKRGPGNSANAQSGDYNASWQDVRCFEEVVELDGDGNEVTTVYDVDCETQTRDDPDDPDNPPIDVDDEDMIWEGGCQDAEAADGDPDTHGRHFPCHPHPGFVELIDTDLIDDDADEPQALPVRLTSDRDPLGIDLFLTETGVQTGVFRGHFYFNATHSNHSECVQWEDTRRPSGVPRPGPVDEDPDPVTGSDCVDAVPMLWALGCDSIHVTYQDAFRQNGKPGTATHSVQVKTIKVADDAPECGDQNHVDITGSVAVNLRETATDTQTRTDFYGETTAWVRLVDPNLSQIPGANHDVIVSRADSPAQWQCCWNASKTSGEDFGFVPTDGELQAVSGAISVTVMETASGSGVFVGQFSFCTGMACDPAAAQLVVQDGAEVCVQWLHKNRSGANGALVNATVVQHCATWHETKNAEIKFRSQAHGGVPMDNTGVTDPEAKLFYRGVGQRWSYVQDTGELNTSQGWVFVQDQDIVADPTRGTDRVTINVRSESYLRGIAVPLYERYGHHRMQEGVAEDDADLGFFGVFNFTTERVFNAQGQLDHEGFYDRFGYLLVSDGDTVSAFYVDPKDEAGQPATYVAFVDWEETHTATLSLDRGMYRGTEEAVTITLTDKDLDTGVQINDETLRVKNDQNEDFIDVLLEETGSRTGVFRGQFGFCTAEPSCADDELLVRDEDTFTVYYTDEHDAHGHEQELEATAQWFDAVAARFRLDKEVYAGHADQARITLEDKTSDRTSGRDSVFVWVTSDSDGAGERVRLEETGGRTGVFEGEIAFEANHVHANGRLHVRDGDFIRVYFLDRQLGIETTPSYSDRAVKTAEAEWLMVPNQAPVLSLETMPPVDVDGVVMVHAWPDTRRVENSRSEAIAFFPKVTDPDGRVEAFTLDFGDGSPLITQVPHRGPADEPLIHTFGVDKFYQGAGTVREYDVVLTAWDDRGAVNSTTVRVRTVEPGSATPGQILNLGVRDIKSDVVELNFTAPQGDLECQGGDGVQCGPPDLYEVRHSTAPITPENYAEATRVPSADLEYVRVQPGQTQVIAVQGLESDTDYYFAVRGATDDAVTHALAERLTLGGFVEDKPLGNYRFLHYNGDGELVLVLKDRAGLDSEFTGVGDQVGPVRTTIVDTTPPPIVALLITSSSHAAGVESNVTAIAISWPAVVDPESEVRYKYYLDSDAPTGDFEFDEDTPLLRSREASYTRSDGEYWFHLLPCSQGGCWDAAAAVHFGPIIINTTAEGPPDDNENPPPTDAPVVTDQMIIDANKALQASVRVVRNGTDNVITWDLPATTLPLEGVQVWRQNGDDPFVLVADLDKDSEAFKNRSYRDVDAPRDSKYIVTAYFAKVPGSGHATEDPTTLPGFSGLTAASVQEDVVEPGRMPMWLIIALALAALVLVGLVVGVLVARRGRGGASEEAFADDVGSWGDEAGDGGEEGGWPPEEPLDEGALEGGAAYDEPLPEEDPYVVDAPEAEEEVTELEEPAEEVDPLTHHLSCPSCGAGFTAHGEKPMVTECPSCGTKGILR